MLCRQRTSALFYNANLQKNFENRQLNVVFFSCTYLFIRFFSYFCNRTRLRAYAALITGNTFPTKTEY